MTDFQWQTEDEVAGRADEWVENRTPPPKRRRPWRRLVVTGLVGLLAGALFAFGLLQEQADQQEEQLARELQVLFSNFDPAVHDGRQGEVAAFFDPNAPAEWQREQLFAARELRFLGPDRHTRVLTATLLDPTYALVDIHTTYGNTAGDNTDGAIWSEQTVALRLDGQRWRLTPLPAHFWGTTGTLTSEHFLVHYHRNDTDLVAKLLPTLEQAYTAATQLLGVEPGDPGTLLEIRLSPDEQPLAIIPAQATTLGLRPPRLNERFFGVPPERTVLRVTLRWLVDRSLMKVRGGRLPYPSAPAFYEPLHSTADDWLALRLGLLDPHQDAQLRDRLVLICTLSREGRWRPLGRLVVWDIPSAPPGISLELDEVRAQTHALLDIVANLHGLTSIGDLLSAGLPLTTWSTLARQQLGLPPEELERLLRTTLPDHCRPSQTAAP
jgi:hypothetical protein